MNYWDDRRYYPTAAPSPWDDWYDIRAPLDDPYSNSPSYPVVYHSREYSRRSRRRHRRRSRSPRRDIASASTSASVAAGEYVTRHLLPALRRDGSLWSRTVVVNFGTMVVPDGRAVYASDGAAGNTVVYNAPGGTMVLAAEEEGRGYWEDPAPTRGVQRVTLGGDASLRRCDACGVLRLVSGVYCRDCEGSSSCGDEGMYVTGSCSSGRRLLC